MQLHIIKASRDNLKASNDACIGVYLHVQHCLKPENKFWLHLICRTGASALNAFPSIALPVNYAPPPPMQCINEVKTVASCTELIGCHKV
jgi:hypothetical protein